MGNAKSTTDGSDAAEQLSRLEWLETDGLGGYACGTASLVRTRRYHGLVVHAKHPPVDRVMLLNGLDFWLEYCGQSVFLSSQHYTPDHQAFDGVRSISSFENKLWPQWMFQIERPDQAAFSVRLELFVPHGRSGVVLYWAATGPEVPADLVLVVRPFLSGRDFHTLHHKNEGYAFEPIGPDSGTTALSWNPYGEHVPGLTCHHNGVYHHSPTWYRGFLYARERERGLDFVEDLASPGELRFDLTVGTAYLVALTQGHETGLMGKSPREMATELSVAEVSRRLKLGSRLHRAADAYIVKRGSKGKTIIAGYPWFGDWGRDTFIALRGLCIATGRLGIAKQILLEWASVVSEGMLPNLFPDGASQPEYNSVDAALWYIIAASDFFEAVDRPTNPTLAKPTHGTSLSPDERERIWVAILAILAGYESGTRYAIGESGDGLLNAGQPGVQLTWMDAKVGDWVVTPRVGKPVEIQALWLNAMAIGGQRDAHWKGLYSLARTQFLSRFWDEDRQRLVDVADGPDNAYDRSFRPNQIFAVGGLPHVILPPKQAHAVVAAVERELVTPLGLRTLAPSDPDYRGYYGGDVLSRDGSYHQGTVWPWLMGPFVEAWLRLRDSSPSAKAEAKRRFVDPLMVHLDSAGVNHVSEIADGAPPHIPRGCPFQAWSVGELIRMLQMVSG